MTRRLIYLVCITILPLFSGVNVYASNLEWFSIGLGGGAEQLVLKQTADYRVNSTPTDMDFNFDVNKATVDELFLLHLGYGENFSRYYFGIDLDKPLTVTDVTVPAFNEFHFSSREDQLESRIKIRKYFTLHLTPGYFLTPETLIYANLGVVSAKVSLDAVLNDLQYNARRKKLFPQFGLGVLHKMGHAFWAKLDYLFTDYHRITAFGSQTDTSGANPVDISVTNTADPFTQSVVLTLVYFPFANGDGVEQNHSVVTKAFDGWNMGVSGDWVQYILNQHVVVLGTANLQLFNANKSVDRLNGEVHLAYGRSDGQYYLGAVLSKQLFRYYVRANAVDSSGTAPSGGDFLGQINSQLSGINYFSLDLKNGFFVSKNTMVYGLLGVDCSKLRFHGQLIRNEGSALNNVNYSFEKFFVSPEVGLGIERSLTTHLKLDVNYVATFYPKHSIQQAFVDVRPSGSSNKTIINHPRLYTNELRFGINYYFS